MDLESYFISQFKTKVLGDDAAVIDELIYSKDAFFENVHFKREWMNYKDIAKRAMLVNLSDAVAMNAKPLYALLAVAMPKDISNYEAKELAKGFQEVAKNYGVKIIGGDTIANLKLDITITIVSKSKKPLFRKGLREGHLLAYTGELGKSAKELKRVLRGGKLHKRSKFRNIELRGSFISSTRDLLSCGMDISDGLFSELEKLSKLNKKGFRFLKKVPKSVGCSGEEYEMLVGFDVRHKKAIIQQAKRTKTPLHIFAKTQRGSYKNICKRHHFG
ncbi:Thiamine-monophosphate kinase [hydrothermal vent metagenome]|uniref:Thiamine-monophosphate kinase n=1 Tax=hydrothermal vent metagenome TaxID=652676 RepID=A0A1W1C061_9ZZZZ